MPSLTDREYAVEDFEELADQLQGLADYFLAVAEKMRKRAGKTMAVSGESSRKNGLKALRTFKSFTEESLSGDGPKQAEKKAASKVMGKRPEPR